MDIRWLVGALGALLVWAANTKLQFILFGHLFVIPVLVLVAALLALVILALIAFIVRSILDGRVVIGGTT
jgi:hypothetical protein